MWKQSARTAHAIAMRCVESNDGRGFAKPVSLKDRQAQRGGLVEQYAGYARATDRHELHIRQGGSCRRHRREKTTQKFRDENSARRLALTQHIQEQVEIRREGFFKPGMCR